MTVDDPGRPEDRKVPEDHEVPLLLFDDDGRPGPSRLGWMRRVVTVVLLAAVVAATAWAYRVVRSSMAPTLAPAGPATRYLRATATSNVETHRAGLRPLPDSVRSGPVGSSVTLTVRATGSDRTPLASRVVRFQVAEGSGTLSADSVITDSEGLAQTTLVLPPLPEQVVVTARMAGVDLPGTRFSVTAESGAPAHVEITAGDRQRAAPGALLPQSLAVRVTDLADVPVRNVEVRFQTVGKGGMVAPSRVLTDSTGSASALWRLRDSLGEQHVAVSIPQLPDTFLTFTATAVDTASTGPPSGDEGPPTEPGAPPEPVDVARRPFAVGGSFVCDLRDHGLSCRGADDQGQSLSLHATELVALAAGVSHACGLTATGKAFCWGADGSGQLGDGLHTDRSVPVEVSASIRFGELAAGLSHTCGLTGAGQAFCWGSNVDGQLGDGSREDHATPQAVSGSEDFRTLVAGWNHTCGLSARGEAYCWGLNDHGQLGDGSHVDRSTPTRVPGTFESLVAGSAHTCGIRQGAVLCWGDDAFGQLGDGSTQDRAYPQPVEGLPGPAVELAAGAMSTCALLRNGAVYCWGQNLYGQLGDGARQNHDTPSAVRTDVEFRSIFSGGALTCGFSDGGTQYCWGLNQSGQLGDGTRVSRSVPTRVGG